MLVPSSPVGYGRAQRDIVGYGRVGQGRAWHGMVGHDRVCQDMAGYGRTWQGMAGHRGEAFFFFAGAVFAWASRSLALPAPLLTLVALGTYNKNC